MDRRMILTMMLCLGFFYIWAFVTGVGEAPTEEELEQRAAQDSISEPSADAPLIPPTPDTAEAPTPSVPVTPQPLVPEVPVRTTTFSACDATFTLTTDGGFLRDVALDNYTEAYEMTPLYSWIIGKVTGSGEGSWNPYGDPPGAQKVTTNYAQLLGMGSGNFESESPRVRILKQSETELVYQGVTRQQIEVTRSLRVNNASDPCIIETDFTWKNLGNIPFEGQLWLGMHDRMPAAGAGYYSQASMPVWMAGEENNSWPGPNQDGWFSSALTKPELQEGAVNYFGIADGYFSTVLVSPGAGDDKGSFFASNRITQVQTSASEPVGKELTPQGYGGYYVVQGDTLAPGGSVQRSFSMYTGANKPKVLGQLDRNLTYLIDLGWFAFFGWPLLYMLNMFYGLCGNWGLSIILLTVTVKLLFFPLTQRAFKSSQRMQAIQPEMKKIREEFKSNPEELNRRTMQLFRENKVNPLGGCMPMLIQMPIWIALYRVLLNSVDLFHTEWFYLQDLSSVDPYCIMPVIVVVMMLIQQQFTPMGNMDPAQARMMKMMPLLFGFFFFTFPSGLVLYIFVNMLLTIAQQWIIKRQFGQNKEATAPAA